MKKSIEQILDICLKKLDEGVSIDKILLEYPEYKEELKELLSLAKSIKDRPIPQPSENKIISCLVRVGEAIQLQKQKVHKVRFPRLFYLPSPVLARALIFVLIIIFISWGTVNLSADSIPGSPLYPVKLKFEKVKFFLKRSPENKVELRLVYSEKRMKELVKYFNRKGEVNTEVLKAMLDEARFALENVSRIGKIKRAGYYSKLEHLSAYQKDILEALKPKVKPAQREELEKAIKTCGRRMQEMMKMKQHHMPMMKMMHNGWGM